MIFPDKPKNEADRLEALRGLRILDTPAEERFDRLTRLARRLLQVPIAAVSLVDAEREWFKSKQGVEACEAPRDVSFCGHAILGGEPLVVPDAAEDPRFRDNPQVTGPSRIRFYAGVPLLAGAGRRIGAFCVKDVRPRRLSPQEMITLEDLAAIAQHEIDSTNVLRQAQKLSSLGEMTAGVAHEMNNAIGILLGFVQALAKRVPESDPLAFPVRSAEREALRCKDLVSNLLSFTRRHSESMEAVSLNEVVDGVLGLVQARARLKSVEITKDLALADPVRGNKNQLKQVLINLCNNAIDAMPDGGRIAIRTFGSNGQPSWAVVEIEDTGSGIAAEILDKIFQPFFTTKGDGQGTGLGLSLVHEIVRKHEGTIEVKSQVGRGTTFTLRFPTQKAS